MKKSDCRWYGRKNNTDEKAAGDKKARIIAVNIAIFVLNNFLDM